MTKIILETKRCILKGVMDSDRENFINLNTNEQSRFYLGGIKKYEEAIEEFNTILSKDPAFFRLMIFEKETLEFIGMVVLDKHHDYNENEVSYLLLPKWWNKGIGYEVISTFLEYSFDSLKQSRIYAETQTRNMASCRLLEKNGMKLLKKKMRYNEEQSIYFKNS